MLIPQTRVGDHVRFPSDEKIAFAVRDWSPILLER